MTRYELTNDSRGFVRGLLDSAAKAQLPAVVLLTLIALLTGGLFFSTLKTDSWRPPVVASALWAVVALVAGIIYPATIQSLVVNPNQRDKEAQYIVRNIDATRDALGIDDVTVEQVKFADITTAGVGGRLQPLKDVRKLKPETMVTRFRTDQSQKAGLTINDLDPDRYDVDGGVQQVRSRHASSIFGQVANKSWQGHTSSTPTAAGWSRRRPARSRPTATRPIAPTCRDRPARAVLQSGLGGYSIVNSSV